MKRDFGRPSMSSACDGKTTPGFPVRRVADVEPRSKEQRWLVHSLWLRSAVGVIGGLPKCFKTWFAIELSWAVASGRKALGHFDVEQHGPVLVFLAEDEPSDMRLRFDSIAKARGTDLRELPISFIDVPTLYLDELMQIEKLHETIDHHRPRLLVLDPFVRLVRRVDENSAGDVSAVLGELRRAQRQFDVAIALVHHMRKARSSNPGQQLRGSGDFAAWCDSAIYLSRKETERLVTLEHRSAAPPEPFRIRLVETPYPHLELIGDSPTDPQTKQEKSPLQGVILDLLHLHAKPQSTVALRDRLNVRKATLVQVLNDMADSGSITREEHGWIPKPIT